jgi:hypothetical protein
MNLAYPGIVNNFMTSLADVSIMKFFDTEKYLKKIIPSMYHVKEDFENIKISEFLSKSLHLIGYFILSIFMIIILKILEPISRK